MSRPSLPGSPPSQPSPYRYLGRGGGSDRPLRLQMVLALVAGLVLVAVPLYLWRRPRPEPIASAGAATADQAGLAVTRGTGTVPVAKHFDLPPPKPVRGVYLEPFQTLKCESSGPGKTPPDKCDRLTTIEDALARAVRETFACAPEAKVPYKISYVLEVDFRKKTQNVFMGKSSTLPRERTRELLKCVRKAFPKADLSVVPHQYARYRMQLVASYPAVDAVAEGP